MKLPKLIRDNIPDIALQKGETLITHIADESEYRVFLQNKLQEEVDEVLEDGGNIDEELADLLEVIHAICDVKGFSFETIEQKRLVKKEKRGGFENKIILDSMN